jgi:DNA-binding response OmpR family regulator
MPLRILIVEDEFLLAFDVQCTLEHAGHHVAGFAADSTSARKLADQTQFDVAIVDLNLRDGPTGAELGRVLVEAGISVIYLTGNGHDLPEGLNGAVGLVDKPYDERRLENVLQIASERRRRSGGRDEPPRPKRGGQRRGVRKAA